MANALEASADGVLQIAEGGAVAFLKRSKKVSCKYRVVMYKKAQLTQKSLLTQQVL